MTSQERGIAPKPEGTGASLPAGVSEKTFQFLTGAIKCGAYGNLNPTKRNLIGIYFGTEAILADLTQIARVKTGESVRNLIRSGMRELWQDLPLLLQEKYPPDEVIKLKDPHSSLTRKRISEACQRGWLERRGQGPETRRKRSKVNEGRFRIGSEVRALWQAAKEGDILGKVIDQGYITEEEKEILKSSCERGGRKLPVDDSLIERFSVGVARVAAGLER